MDLKKYITLFLQEMRDNLAQLNRHLVTLEKDPNNIPLLQEIMRLAHSSKGSSNAMGFKSTAELFHALEDVFDAARKATLTVQKAHITLCLQAFDQIQSSFTAIEKTQQELDCSALAASVRAILSSSTSTLPSNLTLSPNPSPSPSPSTDAFEGTTIDFIRVDTKKIDALTNLAGEFALLKQRVKALSSPQIEPIAEQLKKLTDDLTFYAMDMRLIPLEQAFVRFPRLIRDLAAAQNKNVRFEMVGTDITLDKTLVDHLVSPLVHLLRNAVDHGIESPEERTKAGKNAEALIRLIVERDQGFVRVSVEDDGAPIVLAALKEIAKKKGFAEEQITPVGEQNILDLITLPGFSSSATVTDVSGRGVGLSAARQTAKMLGGQLTLERTESKKRFTLSLPLQLSIIQALLIESNQQTYALPLVHVRRLLALPVTELKWELGEPAAIVDGNDVPLLILKNILSAAAPTVSSDNGLLQLVLVEGEHGLTGLVVDRIEGNADIMVKPVSHLFSDRTSFVGSTILGSGRVAMILDIPNLCRAQAKRSASPRSPSS